LPAAGGRTAATCFLLATLGLQVIAGFKLLAPPERFTALQPLRVAVSPALWPFLDYDMYTRAWPEGSYGQRYLLVALAADGTERPLTQADFDCSWRTFRDEVLYPLRDDHRGAAERVAARLAARGAARPAGFRVDVERLLILRAGLQDDGRRPLRTLPLGETAP
jgi:hypothetical protein